LKNVVSSAIAASCFMGQVAWGEQCLEISDIAGLGKFSGSAHQF